MLALQLFYSFVLQKLYCCVGCPGKRLLYKKTRFWSPTGLLSLVLTSCLYFPKAGITFVSQHCFTHSVRGNGLSGARVRLLFPFACVRPWWQVASALVKWHGYLVRRAGFSGCVKLLSSYMVSLWRQNGVSMLTPYSYFQKVLCFKLASAHPLVIIQLAFTFSDPWLDQVSVLWKLWSFFLASPIIRVLVTLWSQVSDGTEKK